MGDSGSLELISLLVSSVVDALTKPTHLFYWPYLISSALIGLCYIVIFKIRRPFESKPTRRSELSKDVFWPVFNLWFLAFVCEPSSNWLNAQTIPSQEHQKTTTGSFGLSIIYTFVLALTYDFLYFFGHYGFHKLSLFWRFHRLHHSATQLTPLTVLRQNPIELFISGIFITLSFNFLDNTIKNTLNVYLHEIQACNINLVLFVFFISGYHLRHSQITVRFPTAIERHLISPAMHQLHHSCAQRHKDKNFGLIFSYWDRMFGSFLHSETDPLTYGIIDASSKNCKKGLNKNTRS